MTLVLCPHAPKTWEWECDLSYIQGNGREKAQGDSFQPDFEGMLSLDMITPLYPLTCLISTRSLNVVRHQLCLS